MGKTVEEICNLLVKNYTDTAARNVSVRIKNVNNTLASCVCCTNIEKYNPYQALFHDENLYNSLERKITTDLALAIDQNNVCKVKFLKNKYGNLKEFKNAREFLNKKCKEIWNVYEPINHLPKEAMKCLGITNQPDLNTILDDSLKYYEKNDSDTTSYIISSIIKNKNLSYTIEDIHNYLKKSNYKCNFKTVRYLIKEQSYKKDKLIELGIEKSTIDKALKTLPLKYRLKYLF